MYPLLRSVNWAAKTFNELPIWKGECRVWTQRMISPNFERWLYLRAHQVGMMGRDEREFLEKTIRPGMQILDVGSNIGLYSIILARLAGPEGRVTSFEPDLELFTVFRRNCELNGIVNLTAHQLALGSARARLLLNKMIVNSGDNHLGATPHVLFREAIAAEVVSLDEHLPNLPVDFVKLDVQGWELEALRGMRRMLTANRNVKIYFEFMPQNCPRAGSSYDDLLDYLQSLDFQIMDPVGGQVLDRAALTVLAKSLRGLHYTNLLACR